MYNKQQVAMVVLGLSVFLSGCSIDETRNTIESTIKTIQEDPKVIVIMLKDYAIHTGNEIWSYIQKKMDHTEVFQGAENITVTGTDSWNQAYTLREIADIYHEKINEKDMDRFLLALYKEENALVIEKKIGLEQDRESLGKVMEWLHYRYGKGKKSGNVIKALTEFGFTRAEATLLEKYWRDDATEKEQDRLFARLCDYTWLHTTEQVASEFAILEGYSVKAQEDGAKSEESGLNIPESFFFLDDEAYLYMYIFRDAEGTQWHYFRASIWKNKALYTLTAWLPEEKYEKEGKELVDMMLSVRYGTQKDEAILGIQKNEKEKKKPISADEKAQDTEQIEEKNS